MKHIKTINEIWKDIQGYEGLYQVSNFGRVKSLARYSQQNHLLPEKILKQSKINGYYKVNLQNKDGVKTQQVHRLVATAFIDNPYDKPCVNHIDGDKTNNNVRNLEWCTVSENNKHAYKMGLVKQNKNPVIATNIQTGEVKYFESQTEAANVLNTSKGHINDCLKGKQKTCKGYTFEYIN